MNRQRDVGPGNGLLVPRLNDTNYFWLTGEFTDHEPENEKNDHWALVNGYVAITPTTVDVTAYGFMDELNKWFN